MTTPDGWKRLNRTVRMHERVRVDGPARFSVSEVMDSRFRVTIEAPESTRIFRDEDAAPPEPDDSGAE